MRVESAVLGTTDNGEEIGVHTVSNDNGYAIRCMDFGATLISVKAPDRQRAVQEITLGYDTLDQYLAGHPYFGSTVGRVANRIGGARFELDGKTITLPGNEESNMLHGGEEGFHAKVWASQTFRGESQAGVIFTLRSPDGDQGFPGTLDATVTISLTADNELILEYRAETDAPTPVNLTNHTYWNLAGAPDVSGTVAAALRADEPGGRIGGHVIAIPAETLVAVDDASIPTGELMPVEGTPFDFTEAKAIGRDIGQAGIGYDHSYVIGPADGEARAAAVIRDPATGRQMAITTTCPAVQFYTGNYLEGMPARNGQTHRKHNAFCLETQFYPDSVNHENFPSTILRPGQVFEQRTVHAFSVE